MRVGEIYFILERDRRDGAKTSYVKIGMVSDTSRGSRERLAEHQTGNPRDLVLHHVTQTPNPFRVERFLHQKFGPKRVRSEWFRLGDVELAEAVAVSERLAKEAFESLPVIEKAKKLGSVISKEAKIAATPEATDWHRRLMVAKHAVKVCKHLSEEYLSVTSKLPKEVRKQVENEELVITEHYVSRTFDQDGFAAKHPRIFQQFLVTSRSVSGRFTPSSRPVDLEEMDRDLASFSRDFEGACDRVRAGELIFSDLFFLHQDLEIFEGAYAWDEEIADAHLRVLCGKAAGIEGLCTWNRTEKTTTGLDRDGLEAAHGPKVEAFTTTEIKTRTKTKKRSRRQG